MDLYLVDKNIFSTAADELTGFAASKLSAGGTSRRERLLARFGDRKSELRDRDNVHERINLDLVLISTQN